VVASDVEHDALDALDDTITATDVDELLSKQNDSFLPRHMRCASHTLNLVATTDFTKIVADDSSSVKRDFVVPLQNVPNYGVKQIEVRRPLML
jgi:hypothetical protein